MDCERNTARRARLNEFCAMLCVCICAALTAGPSLGIDVKVALCATLAVLSGEFKRGRFDHQRHLQPRFTRRNFDL